MPLEYSPWPSALWGLAALIALWLIGGFTGNAWNPLKLAEGTDGRPSTSKLQWLFWTAIVFFAYVVLYATRAMDGVYEPIATIPQNVLIAMGLSAATMAAAKGITVGYINSGRITKDPVPPAKSSVAHLITDDDNAPDLSKVQMLAWTALAGVIYLIKTFQMVGQYVSGDSDLSQLPDIDTTLMVLMGIGHAAYLGKKAADIDTPETTQADGGQAAVTQVPTTKLLSAPAAGPMLGGVLDVPSEIANDVASVVMTPINVISKTVGNISSAVSKIPGDVASVGNQVTAVGKDVTTVVTRLGSGLEEWVGEVGSAAGRQISGWGADLTGWLQQDEQKIRAAVTSELNRADTQFKPLLDHILVVRALNESFEFADRFKMAANSMLVLIEKLSTETKELSTLASNVEVLLFGASKDPKQPSKDPTQASKDAEQARDEAIKALVELNMQVMLNMNPVVGVISRLLPLPGQSTGIFQNLFPFWIPPGTLNQWINGDTKSGFGLATFTDVPDTKAKELANEELAFRRELVAAMDLYFRSGSVSYGALLRATDQRDAAAALVELFGVLCSTVFGFVLRCPGMPSPSLTKAPFANASPIKTRNGDIGSDVAAAVSRQIVHPMKSMLGVVLNGLWVASPNNQALVEAVSGGLSHVVRSLLEYVLNSLFWSVEIRETYEDGSLAKASELGAGWLAAETYQAGQAALPLHYRVYRRAGLLDAVPASDLADLLTSDTVFGLLQDYAAYRDAVAEYRGFGAGQEVDKLDPPTITFDQAHQTVQVKVSSDWGTIDFPSVPVLRAYCNGVPTVLTCTDAQGTKRQYQGSIDGAAQNDRVWVLSNYGGFSFTGMKAN